MLEISVGSSSVSFVDRIQLSVSRLKTLYETLQYKQLYKLKMEKLLLFMLRGTKADENGDLKLPEPLQAKQIPYHRSRLPQIPMLDFVNVEPADVPDFVVDLEYQKTKEQQNYTLLARQESISKWLESINTDLMAGKSILFDEWFKNIYSKEKNLEVPIDVCFGLIQRYSKNKDIEFVIDKTKPFYPKEDLALWKMKIQTSNS